ncbi:glutamyl-tRNA amidotransferase [Pseudoalteromonas sp. HM-SA03]|uniref:GAD-like domain-containing protein n=1 Tax=Pseudoalteromonas sp. HM-SA03 TaxID=2029678 RepID=UPI000BAE4053|nr:GAD-like domain-containing protein [Pseudoalteromonas sp. HM-SA03]PAX99011.1 glutamyl-tRNA amidotransferase [Pseudoalteromonas sp. HM-SA03]
MTKQFEIDEDLDWFLEKFEEPSEKNQAPAEIIKKFEGKLPTRLLEYWSEYGFSGFGEGLFWLTNPDDFEDTLDAWLGDIGIIEQDTYYVIARSAFGELFLWGEKFGHKYLIDPSHGWIIEKEGNAEDIAVGEENDAIQFFFSAKRPTSLDIDDTSGGLLFEKCKLRLSQLKYNEMYAFEPAFFLGGQPTIDNVSKVNIFAHLSVLASFGQKEILDQQGLIAKAYS